jgi:hypothetical protein
VPSARNCLLLKGFCRFVGRGFFAFLVV